MSKLVSLLMPSRSRYDYCRDSMISVFENCHDPEQVEIILCTDDDDSYNYQWVNDFAWRSHVVPLEFPRYGNMNLHKYINHAALRSDSKWLMLWNDDVKMITKGWDKFLRETGVLFETLSPNVRQLPMSCLFPIIPRKWVEITGRFSGVCSNDSWVERISRNLGILRLLPEIEISHEKEIAPPIAGGSPIGWNFEEEIVGKGISLDQTLLEQSGMLRRPLN